MHAHDHMEQAGQGGGLGKIRMHVILRCGSRVFSSYFVVCVCLATRANHPRASESLLRLSDYRSWGTMSWSSWGGSNSWHKEVWSNHWQRTRSNQSSSQRQWHDRHINQWQGQGAAQYASVTTLGLKNALPLDERRELLLELIHLGTDGEHLFPRMAVFNWGAVTVQACFMILTQAEPGTPFRTLRDDQGGYSKEHAAHVLLDRFKALYQTPEERSAIVAKLRDQRIWDAQDAITAEAKNLGLDPQQLENKNLYCPTPITAALAPIRKLKRNTTAEIVPLEKKQKLLALQRNVQMQEHEITATTGHGVGTDQAPHNAVDPKSQVPDKARDPNVMSLLVSSLPSASFLGIGGTAKDASEGIMKQIQLESMKGATDHTPASNPLAAVHQALARLGSGSKESEQAARQDFTEGC